MSRRALFISAAVFFAAVLPAVPAQTSVRTEETALTADQLRVTRLYEKGNQLLSARRYAEAERAFLDALKLAPGISAVRHGLGLVYVQTGDYELAVLHLEEALRLEPDQIKSLFALARAYGETGESGKSRQAYERILVLDPGFEKAHEGLAGIYYKEKNWEKTLEAVQRSRGIKPVSRRSLMMAGVAGVRAGRMDIALDAVTELRQRGYPNQARRLEYLIFSSKEDLKKDRAPVL